MNPPINEMDPPRIEVGRDSSVHPCCSDSCARPRTSVRPTLRRHRSPRPAIAKQPLEALRRAFGQRLDERALDTSLRDAAAIDQSLQRLFQRAQITYALPDVCQFVLSDALRCRAGPAIVERQQRFNIIERETQRLRTLDEAQPRERFGRIAPYASCRSLGGPATGPGGGNSVYAPQSANATLASLE